MKIALGSDMRAELVAAVEAWLRRNGHEPVAFGAIRPGDDDAWPSVGRAVAEAVASGECASGIVCCWTGTGVSIAANKVPGIRAALCWDAATAAGARKWNDANVLALSIRFVSAPVAEEILAAWFGTAVSDDDGDRAMIAALRDPDQSVAPSSSF